MGTYKNRQAVKYITIAVVTFVISLIVYIITAHSPKLRNR